MIASTPDMPRHLKRFFSEYLLSQRNCSPHTLRSYRDAHSGFLRYLHEKKKIAPDQVEIAHWSVDNIMGFLNDLQETHHNGNDTRNARLAAIRCFVKYLLMVEPTLSSDLQGVLAIPVKRSTRQVLDFLTREEVEALLEAPDADTWSGKRDRVLFATMYNTGARVSEIVGAKVCDAVLQSAGTMRLHGKGRKERVLPLWKRTVKTLKQWIEANHLRADAPLFSNARGAPLTRSGVEKRLHDAVGKAGATCPSIQAKDVSPHTLRHTTAMHLLQSGVDITLIAMWLGHESIETTHIYMTTDLKMKEQALQALQPPEGGAFRFRPTSKLMTFLQSL